MLYLSHAGLYVFSKNQKKLNFGPVRLYFIQMPAATAARINVFELKFSHQ